MIISYQDYEIGTNVQFSESEFVSLIKGSSIQDVSTKHDLISLRLSNNYIVDVKGNLDVKIVTPARKLLPPVTFQIFDGKSAPPAFEIERRIHALRQLYASTFLVESGRSDEIVSLLKNDPKADLEAKLLNEEDWLFLSAASEGSFWITLLTRSKGAFKSLMHIAPLFWDEGRKAMLERVRATTELRKLDVLEKEMELCSNLVDLVKKVEAIRDPNTRQVVRDVLSSNLYVLNKKLPTLPKPDANQQGS